MIVREIRPDEMDGLIALYAHLHEADDPLPEREDLKALWESILANPLLAYFVAEINGLLVSSCTMAVIPNLTRGARPYALIENVVTRREFRGKGIGKALLGHALNHAWIRGCYKVMLLSGRERAQGFYEKAGFSREDKTGFVARPPRRSP